MPRNPTKGKGGFIWLPLDPTSFKVKVNGDDITTSLYSSEFTWGVCPEVGNFKVGLINAAGDYTDKYSNGQTVSFYADRSDGTTEIFKGIIDKIYNKEDGAIGFITELSGGHLTRELNDVYVTASYRGIFTCDEIFKQLVDDYLTGYTYSAVEASTVKPTINWDEKPFWDCIFDLCKLAKESGRFDARLDNDKDFAFFERGSKNNTTEHAVIGKTLVNVSGFGTQTMTTKNKVRVYGNDGDGLPIIYTGEDASSEESWNTKELPVFDSKVTSMEQAVERADAEVQISATPQEEGEVTSLLLPSIKPGENLRMSHPAMNINGNYPIFKFTHKTPIETKIIIGTERKTPQLFKKRVEVELANQTITNPFRMRQTINRKFDSLSELTTYDSNVVISGGKVTLSSGTQGTFTFNDSVSFEVTESHLKMVGTEVGSVKVELSTDSGKTYKVLGLNERSILGDFGGGSNVFVRVTINSSTTEIDGISIGLK